MNPNIAGFDLPLLDEGDKLNRILASTLGNQLPTATQLSYSYQSRLQPPQPYWDATHFGLERVAIFQSFHTGSALCSRRSPVRLAPR